ncbi:MAG TPA: hypothetical protein PK644_10680, partial [bacterium]|nr:hypothetical protein [bacterium]
PENSSLRLELGLARHIELSLHSTANIVLFYHLLRAWKRENNQKKKMVLIKRLRGLLKEELTATRQDRELVRNDNRLGYHAEAHTHLFTLADLDYREELLEKEIAWIDKKIGKV